MTRREEPALLTHLRSRLIVERMNLIDARNEVNSIEGSLSLARKLLEKKEQLVAEIEQYVKEHSDE